MKNNYMSEETQQNSQRRVAYISKKEQPQGQQKEVFSQMAISGKVGN